MKNTKATFRKRRGFKISLSAIFWLAVFFIINIVAKREETTGITSNVTEAYVVLAISFIIAAIGFISTLYAIFYLDSFSHGSKKRENK